MKTIEEIETEAIKWPKKAYVTEWAKTLGVSTNTIWNWRRTGKLCEGHRSPSQRVFFTKTEILEALDLD